MMPPRRIRLKSYFITMIAGLFLVPAAADAQTGSVTAQATVSKTVALSVAPNFTAGGVMSSGSTVRITVSGDDAKSPVIHVPLLVRSNSNFKISTVVESPTAEVSQLSIIGVHGTGALVSRAAVKGLNVLDGSPDGSQPMLVVTGPRVSLGGTLNSPNNALQITVLIRLKPHSIDDSSIHLTFVATPE